MTIGKDPRVLHLVARALQKITVVVAIGLAALALPVSAFAAGTGYEGGNLGPTGVPGGYGSIITSQTVPTTGGTVTGTVSGDTITVTVPSGAFTTSEEVTITSADVTGIGDGGVTGDSAVLGIGINITDPTGETKVTSTFSPALTVAITGSFSATDAVVYYNHGTGTWDTLTGVTVTATEISFSITADPDIAVLASSSTSTAPGAPVADATTVHTGKPFLLEEIIAGVLVLFGLATLVWVKRRRPSPQRG
jgi:hypothetical protein